MTDAASSPADLEAGRALIVIPALNEARFIGGVIAAILDDAALVRPLVVVADGGSSDGTREEVLAIAARAPGVRLLDTPHRLQSAAVNLAAITFGYGRRWLIRVDAHLDYPASSASLLITEAQRTGATSVVVSMETRGEGGFQRAAAAAQNCLLGAGGSAHRRAAGCAWVDHGHHALFRTDAFLAAGGYDESFSHNEDAELDVRLRAAGGRIWLTDVLRPVYHPRAAAGPLWRQYLNYGRGRARTVCKHRTGLKARQAAPLAVAPAVLLAAVSPLVPLAALPAAAWMVVCLAFGALLGLRQRDGAVALTSGLAAMVMHLAWSTGFWSQILFGCQPRAPRSSPLPVSIHVEAA